jgi:hypothetical protein
MNLPSAAQERQAHETRSLETPFDGQNDRLFVRGQERTAWFGFHHRRLDRSRFDRGFRISCDIVRYEEFQTVNRWRGFASIRNRVALR